MVRLLVLPTVGLGTRRAGIPHGHRRDSQLGSVLSRAFDALPSRAGHARDRGDVPLVAVDVPRLHWIHDGLERELCLRRVSPFARDPPGLCLTGRSTEWC